jgi:hypothetical protein
LEKLDSCGALERDRIQTAITSESENPMKRIIPALIFAALIGGSAQVIADEAPAAATPAPSHKQFMKDCMAKAKAANNGTSEQDMRKACRDQLKASMGDTAQPNQPVVPAH